MFGASNSSLHNEDVDVNRKDTISHSIQTHINDLIMEFLPASELHHELIVDIGNAVSDRLTTRCSTRFLD